MKAKNDIKDFSSSSCKSCIISLHSCYVNTQINKNMENYLTLTLVALAIASWLF